MDLSLLHTESTILVNMPLLFLCVFNRFTLFPCFLLPLVSFLPQISLDKTGILNHPFLYPIPLGIQLTLQLIPNQFIHARFCEPIPDPPKRGEIRDFPGETRENYGNSTSHDTETPAPGQTTHTTPATTWTGQQSPHRYADSHQ